MQKTSETLPRLLNSIELAHYLNKSKAWVERSRWDGTGIPFIKVGNRVLYKEEDILAWLDARKHTCTR